MLVLGAVRAMGCLLVYYNLKQAEAADPPTNARETEMDKARQQYYCRGVQTFEFFHPRSFWGLGL